MINNLQEQCSHCQCLFSRWSL